MRTKQLSMAAIARGNDCAHVKGTGHTAKLIVCTSVLKSEMFTPRTKCLSLKNCVPEK